ncbi:excitatory amino acid transporter 1-like [Dendronephthya gigantea]|uniref:excitatory amino acid transporter 1-like n=1 Tax=Dendronephthya gigantea TaxID=151771 RepID=UPI00106A72E6|nr:excitatory amino acid transporter 1-like [Dendronephthya gigantea]
MQFLANNRGENLNFEDVEANLEVSEIRTSRISKIRQALVGNAQLVAIVVSVLLGFLIGILIHDAVQESTETEKVVMYIKFPGELFIRMLRMIIIPLTVSSIVVALAEIDTSSAGKLGRRTFLYYLTTTVSAIIIGLVLMNILRPGEDSTSRAENEENKRNQVTALDSFLDLLRNLIPKNLVEATLKSTQTNYAGTLNKFVLKNKTIPSSAKAVAILLQDNTVIPWSAINGKNVTIITSNVDYKFSGTVDKNGANIIGLIVFSILLGVILRKLGKDGRALMEFIRSWLNVVMMLVSGIMWVSPIGILSLIAGSLADVDDVARAFKDVGLFLAINFIGCFIQALFVYPLLYFFIVRKNPFTYLSGIVSALITALGTSSSSATLPVTIRCVTENNKVDHRVARFCLPIGATCNMDGSALYFAVVVLFMANLNKMSLNFGEIILTALVAIFVSAGSSGIPAAGLSYTVLCLEAVGIPTRFVGLIFTIDWIIDRLCTVMNVMGDAYGAGVINHLSTDLHVGYMDDEQEAENNIILGDTTSF